MATGCTVLLQDAANRQGRADGGPALDDDALARIVGELRRIWPRRAVRVSTSPYATDAKRLGELALDRYTYVVVVRPGAVLLPASVLRDAVDQFSAGRHDLAVLSGIPSDVCYIASGRALTRLIALGGVPGCVTLPQTVERLAAAGASLEGTPLAVARLRGLASSTSQAVAAASMPHLWRMPRLDALLELPSDERLDAALRRQQESFADARAALHKHASPTTRPVGDRHRRVLVVVPSPYQSGAHAAWAELVDDLSPAEVAFVVGSSTFLQDVLEAKGFTTYDVNEGLAAGSTADAAVLMAALDEVQPSVVHFDGAEGSTWAAAVFSRGARVVQHVRLNDVDRFRPALGFASAVVGVSPHVCGEVVSRVGTCVRVEHIPDGVRLHARPARVPGARPPRRNTEGHRVLCLCVGRVEPAKGQLRVLDVFRALRQHVPARLNIVGPCGGDAAYCDEVRDKMGSHDLGGDVTWEPFRYPLDDLYRRAEVVLVGSRNEALGMVGLEALAAGALLVAQRSTGYACIVDPSQSEGLLFEADEPASDVAARIVAALDELPTYAANARRKVATCFDARDCVARLMQLWREVADGQ